jgi:deazaflavin-dependent oxidoreductase (nitroreductase family)
MRVPRAVAKFNRRITNPLAVRFGGWAPLNGTLEHVGRKSGKTYQTPLNIFETADGFVVPVGYGLESHWVQNALAGGPLKVHKAGRTVQVVNARIVSKVDAEPLVTRGQTMFRLHPYNEAALVLTAS